ncbi:MAG: ABC transporter ATP-binding protein [Afipia sp.]
MNAASYSFVKDAWAALRWKLPLLALLTFLCALLEGATVASLLPLLSGFSHATSGPADHISKIFFRLIEAVGLSVTPLSIAVLIVVLIVSSAAAFLLQSFLAARLQSFYVAFWQRRMFSGFLAADYEFFVSRRTGDLVTAIANEPMRIGLVFSQFNVAAAALLFVLVQIVISLFIAPIVVGLLLVFGALLFGLTRWWAVRALAFGTEQTKLNADLIADTEEIIGGAKFVKATATEDRAFARLAGTVNRMETVSFGNTFDAQVVRAIFEYSGGLLVVALLYAGPKFLTVDVGAILVIIAIFVRLFPRITGLRQSLQIIDFHMPAFSEAMRLLREARSNHVVAPRIPPDGWPPNHAASIAIDHLSVQIESRTILDRVNVNVPAGSFVALTGQTGSGKTTLLDCALGLRRPTSGSVKVDGHPLDTLPVTSWRRAIGYLGQDPVLFNASIRDNLRWIRPQTTDEEIRVALNAAAADFVQRLPDGLDTLVGDHGNRLSGGERQRIALARALLGHPRLLVLDEATSSLDADTEELVTQALARVKGRITVIAITHRPALVREADFVINLEKGKAERVVSQSAEA